MILLDTNVISEVMTPRLDWLDGQRSFDEKAARLYGELMGRRRESGRPMSVLDGQIAALTRSAGFALATRNVRHFADCGLEILNPFDA